VDTTDTQALEFVEEMLRSFLLVKALRNRGCRKANEREGDTARVDKDITRFNSSSIEYKSGEEGRE
jgi:hypothetical protein